MYFDRTSRGKEEIVMRVYDGGQVEELHFYVTLYE